MSGDPGTPLTAEERASKQGRRSRPSAPNLSSPCNVFAPMLKSVLPNPLDGSPITPRVTRAEDEGNKVVPFTIFPPCPPLGLKLTPQDTGSEAASTAGTPNETVDSGSVRHEKLDDVRGYCEGTKGRGTEGQFKLIHKNHVHKCIWVPEWHAAYPVNHPDWPEFFNLNKKDATEDIQILENPPVERLGAHKMAQWFKPIRWALCHGDGANDYKGKMFQGR